MRPLLGTLTLALLAACSGASPAGPEDARPYAAAFDRFWSDFDRDYSYFEYKRIDWSSNRDQLREEAASAQSDSQFVDVLLAALQPLRDVHAYVRRPNGSVKASYQPIRTVNWYSQIWRNYQPKLDWRAVNGAWGWGRLNDVGYIEIGAWSPDVRVTELDAALEQLRDTRALIIDVRPNGGGNDAIALSFAGRFTTTPVRFAAVRYRAGASHSDFGPWTDRVLSARGSWQYTKAVYLLIGPYCFSSNESFVAAMTELPQVTGLGDVTGGSSGNPKEFEIVVGGRSTSWKYSVPRWIETLADGTVIEWHGVKPDISVPFDSVMVNAGRDPVLEAAFRRAGADISVP